MSMSQLTAVDIGGLTTRFKINRIPRKHTEVGWGGQGVTKRGVELSHTKRGGTRQTDGDGRRRAERNHAVAARHCQAGGRSARLETPLHASLVPNPRRFRR